jgi:type II secretory pathway pseudopilin PulG
MEPTDKKNLSRFNLDRAEGFSLIEVAIILIIVGLLVGLGAELIGPMTRRAKILATTGNIDSAVESLVSYGAANNSLPVTGSFSATVKDPNDAWTKPLYYIIDNNLTDTSVGGVCGRKTTLLTLRLCPDAGCSTPTETISNVALIVLSGGGNYNNQTTGTQAYTSATTISAYDVDVAVDDYAADIDSADPYDDLFRWVTIDELRTKAGCVGPQLKVINNELPRGYVSSAYSATVFAHGGVPYSSGGKYRWCREEPVSTGLTFTPDAEDSDCLGEAETGGKWVKADTQVISGTPATNGSFSLTFFVRDDNDQTGASDNIAQRTLVMTINPASGGGGGGCSTSCSSFRVWNDLGAEYDFFIDGDCRDEDDGDEITNGGSRRLDSGETIDQYSTSNESCGGGVVSSLTYDDATCADTDGDCRVYFSGADR